MSDPIDDLGPEQAQAALLAFYDRLPEDLWSGPKPTDFEMEGLADYLKKHAPQEVRAEVGAVVGSTDTAVRGAVAKLVLHQLDEIEPFRPFVREAIEVAKLPKMVALPVAMGATLVVIALLPKVTRNAEGHWTIDFDPAGNLKGLIDSLTAFVKELPKGLISGAMA